MCLELELSTFREPGPDEVPLAGVRFCDVHADGFVVERSAVLLELGDEGDEQLAVELGRPPPPPWRRTGQARVNGLELVEPP